MPTAVEFAGPGVKSIIAVLARHNPDPADLPREVGTEFGAAIKTLNFTTLEGPLGQEVKEQLLPAVQHDPVELLGIVPFTPDDGGF
jgi:hypothetical protein